MSMSMTGEDGTIWARTSGFEFPFSCAGDANVGVDGGVLILIKIVHVRVGLVRKWRRTYWTMYDCCLGDAGGLAKMPG